jgi:hypothetical protein
MKVEFRDGIKDVPDYLADMMRGLPTYEMLYEEAVQKANWGVTRRYLNKIQFDVQRKSLKVR